MTLETQPSLDTQSLRQAFGAFATGVTVVTVGGDSPHGMTANSFTSVSLDPPLLLVCIGQGAVMHACLSGSSDFGISVLSGAQEPLARHFADRRRPLGAAQFEQVDCLPGRVTGVPLIAGALAHFECRIWGSYAGGDHTIFLGSVLSADQPPDAEALLFVRGGFRRTGPVPDPTTTRVR